MTVPVPQRSLSAGEDPAERFLTLGEECLTDAELLSLVLGSVQGVRHSPLRIAERMLRHCGSLRRLGRLSLRELCRYPGVGRSASLRILAGFALSRRYSAEVMEPGVAFRSSRDLFRHFHPRLRDRRREEFIAVLPDGKNRYVREVRISLGSLSASIVHPREVFLPAIRESAGGVLLVHNHPSGDPTPSPEDIEVTRRLVRAGEILGIRVLDHVIVGERGYTSLLTGEDEASAF